MTYNCAKIVPNPKTKLLRYRLMRISEHFQLGTSQFELNFVDIDTERDTQLFIDPYFIAQQELSICVEASRSIRSFFRYFLALIRGQRREEARQLFDHLHEAPHVRCRSERVLD